MIKLSPLDLAALTTEIPGWRADLDTTALLARLEALRNGVRELDGYETVLLDIDRNETPELASIATVAGLDAVEAPIVPELDQSAPIAPAPVASAASAPDATDGGAAAGALGLGFWGFFLGSIERTVDQIDGLTDFIGDYLERPGLSDRSVDFMENILEMLDNVLERLDNLLDIVDRWAPPSYDSWIDSIQERIAEERDDIDAILNPPAPVDTPVEEPVTPESPVDTPASDDTDWTAADFTGDGKTVVVIDTGWNTEFLGSHERPVDQFDFYSNDGSAQVGNSNDHGSWVDQVVRTVADGVQMIHLKVFPDTSGGAPMSVIDRALDWVIDAVRNDDYDISAVNLSLGYGNVTSETASGLSDEFATLDDLGVFSVVAAGNSGAYGVQYLAADENTIAVSASTSASDIAGFSQHHHGLTDIFALGQSVRIENEFGGANSVSGTSFAAPYISGIAARLQEAADELIDRQLTDEEFVEILQVSGNDLNGYAGSSDPAGYHIADADAAVTYFIDNYNDYI